MKFSNPEITPHDDGVTINARYENDAPIKIHVHPQTTQKDFARATTSAAEQFHRLFLEMAQDRSMGVDAALTGMSSSLGAAIGGMAQQDGQTHHRMQQTLADYLRSTLASADATYRLHEGGQ